jgi:hypothetical protein
VTQNKALLLLETDVRYSTCFFPFSLITIWFDEEVESQQNTDLHKGHRKRYENKII